MSLFRFISFSGSLLGSCSLLGCGLGSRPFGGCSSLGLAGLGSKKKNTKNVDMPAKLFDEIAPKYTSRNGGYTRIVKIGQRKGDGAMEVLLELV